MVLKVAMEKGRKEKAVTEKVDPEAEVQLAQEVETAEVPGKEVLETEVDQEAVASMEEEETALALVDKSTTSRCRNS